MPYDQHGAGPPPAVRELFTVHPSRLAWGAAGRETCAGDIHASYSADVIAASGRSRKPFKWKGELYVCTGISGSRLTDSGKEEHEAYRMVLAEMFNGKRNTYRDKTDETEDAARNDLKGFYHGMVIRFGTETFVLSGPPVRFIADASAARPDAAASETPVQLGLF